MEAAIGMGMVLFVVVIYGVILLFAIIDYIMRAVALHRLAKRRSIKKGWFAWIPVLSEFLMGKIVEDYDEKNGINRKWGGAILTTAIIMFCTLIVYVAVIVAFAVIMGITEGSIDYDAMTMLSVVFLVCLYAEIIILAIAATVYQVVYYICLYKVFESTVPEKSLKYMILSILVPLAQSICLLRCSKKGYPQPEKIVATEVNPETVTIEV